MTPGLAGTITSLISCALSPSADKIDTAPRAKMSLEFIAHQLLPERIIAQEQKAEAAAANKAAAVAAKLKAAANSAPARAAKAKEAERKAAKMTRAERAQQVVPPAKFIRDTLGRRVPVP